MTQTPDTSVDSPAAKVIHTNLLHVLGETLGSDRDVKAWLQETLGVSFSAVYRKVNSSGLNMSDLESVANGLGISIQDLYIAIGLSASRVVKASMEIAPGVSIEVNAHLGVALPNPAVDLLTAFDEDGSWTIGLPGKFSEKIYYEVKSIAPVETRTIRRTVALLDDEPMVVEQGKVLLRKSGLNSMVFTKADDLANALLSEDFDAFVLDWWLGDQTSEALIRTIRESSKGKTVPICIVTGDAGADPDAVEADLVRVSKQYGCTARIKPIRWKLLGNDFVQLLDENSTGR